MRVRLPCSSEDWWMWRFEIGRRLVEIPVVWRRRVGATRSELREIRETVLRVYATAGIDDSPSDIWGGECRLYLWARETGFEHAEMLGLWLDRVDPFPVVLHVWLGFDRTEALLVSRVNDLDLAAYICAREVGIDQADALELHHAGIELGGYAAVLRAGGTAAEAADIGRAGISHTAYTVCRWAGMSGAEIADLGRAGANLYAAARTRRHARGEPADEYDDWLRILARRADREQRTEGS